MVTWKHFCQSKEGGIVGHKAWGEDKGCIFLVKKGQFFLKSHMVVTCPRDIPGATCSCTIFFQNVPEIQIINAYSLNALSISSYIKIMFLKFITKK